MSLGISFAFVVYLFIMMSIGVYFYFKTNDLSDYILGGRNLGPGVAALSAGASDMSGWLLLGLPGALYAGGMNSIWIAIGLTIGAFLNWQFVARRLRNYTEKAGNSITIPDYLENRFEDSSRVLRVISALVILIFFTIYVSSGLVGGAILFEKTFGLQYQTALWVGALVIVAYTFLGGFMAVTLTDFIQGILMFCALLLVPMIAINLTGGWDKILLAVNSVNPEHLDAFSGMTSIGIISLMAWGLGYFGQPHILTRFMALKNPDDAPKAQVVGMSWMVLGLFGAIFTGFAGIGFLETPLDNPETVFIVLTETLFNPWVAGVFLAAILSAIMSTIDSQLLVCSSAVAEDFYRSILKKEASQKELVWIGRGAVLILALVATAFASNPESRVLELVSYAWGGFGAAFGPVILFSLFWRKMTKNGALAGIVTGAVTVIVWKNLNGGIFDVYEILPGFILCSIAVVSVSLSGKGPSSSMKAVFDEF
ncbi:MAG: sodium/proline symporter PutP [Desulforegulaceae bacterium]|nr:sodium/proline symporter PutP [Desulforegulaceae bacterium]